MSASSDLQTAIVNLLSQPNALRVSVPIVARRPKDLASDIEAASASNGLCIWTMPPLPTSAMQGVQIVFFDKSEVRVRIVEQPAMNSLTADAYDLIDDVATALHWQPERGINAAVQAVIQSQGVTTDEALSIVQADPANAALCELGAILSHPLELAVRPTEMAEDQRFRIIDVIFNAVYELNPSGA